MKKFLLCFCAIGLIGSTLCGEGHLIPAEPNFGDPSPDGPRYAAACDRILYSGNDWLIRYLENTESPSTTLAVAVYRDRDRFRLEIAETKPDLYSVVSDPLNRESSVRNLVRKVSLYRASCLLPSEAATELQRLWLSFLKQTRSGRADQRSVPLFRAFLYARSTTRQILSGEVPPDAPRYRHFQLFGDIIEDLRRCPKSSGTARVKLIGSIQRDARALRLSLNGTDGPRR